MAQSDSGRVSCGYPTPFWIYLVDNKGHEEEEEAVLRRTTGGEGDGTSCSSGMKSERWFY